MLHLKKKILLFTYKAELSMSMPECHLNLW